MYDVLRSRYTFACPTRGETSVALSAFRRLVRLPGARIRRSTASSSTAAAATARRPRRRRRPRLGAARPRRRHVPEPDDVDASTGSRTSSPTSRSRRIQAGEWPWSFFCYPEERPRPVFPSSFSLLAPGGGAIGLAVRCPVCSRVSVNLVSSAHVDLPFHNDRQVGVVAHVFAGGRRSRRSRRSAPSCTRRTSTSAGSRWSNR